MMCRYFAWWQKKFSLMKNCFLLECRRKLGNWRWKLCRRVCLDDDFLDKRLMNIHNYTCDEHFLQMGKMLFECLFWSGRASDLEWMEEGRRNIRRIVNCITSTCDGALSSPAFLFHDLPGRDGWGCMSFVDVYMLACLSYRYESKIWFECQLHAQISPMSQPPMGSSTVSHNPCLRPRVRVNAGSGEEIMKQSNPIHLPSIIIRFNHTWIQLPVCHKHNFKTDCVGDGAVAAARTEWNYGEGWRRMLLLPALQRNGNDGEAKKWEKSE